MLGPGIGALLARLLTDDLTEKDRHVLEDLAPQREFGGMEALK